MQNSDATPSSVDRALELLLLLREGPISVASAAERLGVSRPTASRLLATLKRHDFARQNPDRGYRAGVNLIGPTPARVTGDDLRRLLRPTLTALQEQLNETVNLWVLDGIHVHNVDGIETSELLSIRASAWGRVPAYCSAAGKAILATLSNPEIERMHAGGLPPWRSQRTTTVAALKRHLQTVRRRGYATNLEEASQGVFGVGAAVRTPGGAAIAGLGCGIPSVRYSSARGREIAEVLVGAADEMSAVLQRTAFGTGSA